MYKKIAIIDLWTDANRGDAALQVGLIKMLRKGNPGVSITGIFRFGHNEFKLAKSEISETMGHLDSSLGGIRRTSYAGSRASRWVVLTKLLNLYSFAELLAIYIIYKLGGLMWLSSPHRAVVQALREADLVVWKGKNFRASDGIKGIPRQLTLTVAGFIAGIFSKNVVCVNASFWNINNSFNKWLMKKAFQSCTEITVRDKSSLINASAILERTNIRYCKDLSYFDIYDRIQNIPKKINSFDRTYALALTITKWGSDNEQQEYSEALMCLIDNIIVNDPKSRIVIVPQVIRQAETSITLVERIVQQHKDNIDVINEELTIDELLSVYQESKLLVGTRMHSCVFAAAVGIPFVAIAYDHGPKWEILNDLVDSNYIVPLNKINAADLMKLSKSASLKDFDIKSLSDMAEENVKH